MPALPINKSLQLKSGLSNSIRPLITFNNSRVFSYKNASARPTMFCNASSDSVLVADIGGTNCRFQLWEIDLALNPVKLTSEQFLSTADYPHFDQALTAFLTSPDVNGAKPRAAAFACAGPVQHRKCEMTNLGWTIDAADVESQFNIPSDVLNDFEAVGYGVPALVPSDLVVLNNVPAQPKGPIAVVGPGTGLGEAQLFWNDARSAYVVCPSEGSHATFAPRGDKQRALQAHVEAERQHCSVERVACGSGLVRIYNFLAQHYPPSPDYKHNTDADPAYVSNAALKGTDPVASEALDMMLAIVGAEAGHMALRALTTGGVFICGGIFPKVMDRVKQGGVLEAFLWKESRFYDKVLRNIPLYVVKEDKVGLIGTRVAAIQRLKEKMDDLTIAT